MDQIANVRLCKDCEFKKGIFCEHPNLKVLDYVDGHHTNHSCIVNRAHADLCGPDGKFYSPKES